MSRKQKKYHFIYKTTNVLTGRYYYGMHSTDDLNDGYVGSGKRIKRSINKHGKENHIREIIEFVSDRKKLKQREREVVNLDKVAKKDCMNLMVGGKGGYSKNNFGGTEGRCRGAKSTNFLMWTTEKEKHIKRVSLQSKERWKDENFRLKMMKVLNWTGRKHKEESKKLIGEKNSIHQKGSGNSQYGTCWIYSEKEKRSMKIKKDDLDFYINDSWIKGRKIK